jgi:hypothetical protein
MGKFVSSDGRAFTDYRPNCVVNKKIQQSMNSLEYRKYLQSNASKIMEQNFNMSVKSNKQVCNCQECIDLTKRKF